jgi:hypothetical protein
LFLLNYCFWVADVNNATSIFVVVVVVVVLKSVGVASAFTA